MGIKAPAGGNPYPGVGMLDQQHATLVIKGDDRHRWHEQVSNVPVLTCLRRPLSGTDLP